MLVLTRKQGEKIKIGDDITITVIRTKGKAVRLGIQAPVHVPVLRGEIAAAIAAETEESGMSVASDGADDGESDLAVPDRTVRAALVIHGPWLAKEPHTAAAPGSPASRTLCAAAAVGAHPLRELVKSRSL